MDIAEAIRHRRTIQHYTSDPVSAKDLREMLGLATQAPSVANRQMWRFIVVSNSALLKMLGGLVERKIKEMATWPEFTNHERRLKSLEESAAALTQAPVAIMMINQGYRTPIDQMLVERGMKFWEADRQFSYPDVQSVSGMIAYFMLLAEERGYGTCWMTDPLIAKKDLQAALELQPGEELLAIVIVGRPDEYPTPKARKAIDELIDWRS